MQIDPKSIGNDVYEHCPVNICYSMSMSAEVFVEICDSDNPATTSKKVMQPISYADGAGNVTVTVDTGGMVGGAWLCVNDLMGGVARQYVNVVGKSPDGCCGSGCVGSGVAYPDISDCSHDNVIYASG